MNISLFISKVYDKTLNRLFCAFKGFVQLVFLLQKKDHDEIYLLMSTPLGDCVYGMAYAESLKEYNNKKLVIISDSKRHRLIESYNIDAKIIYLDGTSREWKWIQHLNGSRKCVLIGRKFGIYSIVPWVVYPFRSVKDTCTLDLIREKMLNLPVTAKISYPNFSNEPVKSIRNFKDIKDHIVIINPYSASMKDVDFDFFEKISSVLIEKGYIVYTNVIGNQVELKNTRRLDCPIEEFYAICNQIPLVVSVRSGIIDFCISAKTNFYIIYFLKSFRGKGAGFAGQYRLDAWKTNNVEEVKFQSFEEGVNDFNSYLDNHNLNNILK